MTIPEHYSQVNLKFTATNVTGTAEMTFGVHNSFDMDPATVEGLVYPNWNTNLKGLWTNDVTLASILVKNGPDASGPFIDVAHGTVPSGTGLVVPGQVAALVRKVTLLGGRKGRGRMYHPGVFTGMLNADQSSIAGATITAMNAAYATFLSQLASDDIPMVILHGDATTPTVVTALQVQTQVATQRRRVRR
jgi:hypothetical protein